jgi:HlyD family secretion protein
MHRTSWLVVLVAIVVAAGGAWRHFGAGADPVQIVTAEVAAGDVVQNVACTGTLDAVETVDVGSQVAGTIEEIPVDFNSIVRRGDVLARLDTSLFRAALDQARAGLSRAEADVAVAEASVVDTTQKLNRQKALFARQLVPRSDLDDAQVAADQAKAALKAAEGQRQQARAAVDQAQVDLDHTVIVSPIDGIVVNRKVDVGQTVAASYQTPSMFSIAADLTKMKLTAAVDEADIGQLRAGETARFGVDAYPGEIFTGRVIQVRLQPETVQNVVSYDTIVAVDNAALLLKPGMTATTTIEVARRENVLRVPASALRFRPTQAVLAALGEAGVSPIPRIKPPAALTPGSAGQVWVLDGGRLAPRLVHVGIGDGQSFEIVDGLSAGARVATAAMLTQPRAAGGAAPAALAPQPGFIRR